MTGNSLLRIARQEAPLADKVVTAVRDAISDGTLLPGQRLTEREMIEWTGVSRTSIREALRQLAAQGLIERGPAGGVRVAVLDRQAIGHIYEARIAIETAAAELFIKKATDEQFDELIELGRRYGVGGRPIAAVASDASHNIAAYDELLLRGAQNPILTEMLMPLHARIQGLRRLSMSIPSRRSASRAEIREIIEAVLDRDVERATKASHLHIAAAAEAALSAIEANAQPTA